MLNLINTDEPRKQLADAIDHIILDHKGVKIGIIGLAEEEWLDSIISLEEDDYIYEDFIKSGREWCKKLREEGCEIVIALTHMRMPNDKRLTQKVEDLDLVLGGHDHCSAALNINSTLLCKSGTDFREFSVIEVVLGLDKETMMAEPVESVINYDKGIVIRCKKVNITKEFEPDETMQKIVDGYWEELNKKAEQIAGFAGCELEARFDHVRCQETNTCNFVADVVNFSNNTDVTLFNSGAFRTDEVIPVGFIRWKDIDTLFPIQDPVIIIRTSGENLLAALENGLSEVPKLEGRFPAVSGVRIKYDSSLPAMKRIIDIEVNGEPLQKKRLYTVSTKTFLYKGKDGFDALCDSELLLDEEDGTVANTALVNFFKLMIKQNTFWYNSKQHLANKALKIANNSEKDYVTKDEEGNSLRYNFYKFYPKIDGRLTDVSASS